MSKKDKRKLLLVFGLFVILTVVVFVMEHISANTEPVVTRNGYGQGSKTEEYELTIPGQVERESIQIEVKEREYTAEEAQEMFAELMEKLDPIVLGENESFDRVEKNLNLVTELSEYPVRIQWELDSYELMNIQGEIQEAKVKEEGTLLGIRGTLSYGDEQAVYIRSAMVYPLTRMGVDKMLHEVKQAIAQKEEASREKTGFTLPEEVGGQEIQWSRKKEGRWCYVLLIGIVYCIFTVYRSREKIKQSERRRKEQLLREYPGMISKFTMLLSTGATVRNAWEKIVQNYEKQKETLGCHPVYEEMSATLHEMQSGVSEAETYERFGKRCGASVYIKFGALLSQNLRKGSKGMSDILRMEALRSFEDRKSTARRLGEEAGTKLLMPMLGMLGVVLIIVMVPAFMTMQL